MLGDGDKCKIEANDEARGPMRCDEAVSALSWYVVWDFSGQKERCTGSEKNNSTLSQARVARIKPYRPWSCGTSRVMRHPGNEDLRLSAHEKISVRLGNWKKI